MKENIWVMRFLSHINSKWFITFAPWTNVIYGVQQEQIPFDSLEQAEFFCNQSNM